MRVESWRWKLVSSRAGSKAMSPTLSRRWGGGADWACVEAKGSKRRRRRRKRGMSKYPKKIISEKPPGWEAFQCYFFFATFFLAAFLGAAFFTAFLTAFFATFFAAFLGAAFFAAFAMFLEFNS